MFLTIPSYSDGCRVWAKGAQTSPQISLVPESKSPSVVIRVPIHNIVVLEPTQNEKFSPSSFLKYNIKSKI